MTELLKVHTVDIAQFQIKMNPLNMLEDKILQCKLVLHLNMVAEDTCAGTLCRSLLNVISHYMH
ncbi:hypothetical protein KXD40_000536 [Peronospora effusa]|uniref:Uncharacterized protein n=1 Tax=Peronospora effusa TaxID=542832 RepID=A0A3M6VJ35_9STRA|nr:hypothetical protein DD238_004477 [Peronospora effusa]RQM14858.1 hypothetical protein DD237_005109 [Peronospora effusa]UIZ21687.1 hypothetical protein KXD40_000536 [Peronospora effusa]